MRYCLGYQTHVSLNEIDDYTVDDLVNQLGFIYEVRMKETGKSFIREPKKDELEIAKKLKESYG